MNILKRKGFIPGAMAMLLLAACSGNGGSSNAGSTDAAKATPGGATQPAASTAASVKPANVEITVWDKPKPDEPRKAHIEEIWAGFSAKYPHITVKHETPPTGTSDRQVFMTAMAGGTGPDAYQYAHFPIIQDWIKAGYALDLTKYWNDFADKGKYIPSSLEQATKDGKVYGLPYKMYTVGLIYNKKLYQGAGLDPSKPPANWDEFADYGKKLTDPAKKQYGFALLGMEWADWHFEYYVWQAGGDLTTKNADGTIKLEFTSEPVVKALQYWRDLKWKHKVVQSNVVQNIDDNNKDFFQGRAAMMLGASDSFGGFAKNGVDLNDVGFAPLPVGPSGKAPSQVGGEYWILNPKSSKEKQDAAWLYITYLTSKEVQDSDIKYLYDNGIMPNLLSVRSDVNPLQGAKNVPADLISGVQKAAQSVHLEYALKERLSPYIVKAIQKVLLSENADIAAELKAAQETAQREIVDPYNAEIKK
ncbi:MAG: transporter substrate-binding protein [Paenibacillaceae bacterium]|jgi:ABC-type glycerol-3-phosphate transport system substrate-binding protein|nr:transporter substrate-binding protein [Paenibacillaceae bacterium]